MRGNSKTPPLWALIIEYGIEFGIPPWEVEEQASQEWFDRWLAYRKEKQDAEKKLQKRSK